MNKSQLIDQLSHRFEGNKRQAAHALESVLDTITREVSKGEKVAITGFGSFEKRVRDARWVRNPRTGERMKAKKTSVPKFTPGADLKNVVSGAKKLPKLTLGAAAPAAKKVATTAKKTASAAKSTATKSTATKTAAKKSTSTTAKKAPAKSTPAKKTTATKAPATKAAAKKTSTAKTAAKKTTTTAKKAPAKTAAKKAPAKTAAKKAPAKAAAKKTAKKS